jgi:hypothetical protein
MMRLFSQAFSIKPTSARKRGTFFRIVLIFDWSTPRNFRLIELKKWTVFSSGKNNEWVSIFFEIKMRLKYIHSCVVSMAWSHISGCQAKFVPMCSFLRFGHFIIKMSSKVCTYVRTYVFVLAFQSLYRKDPIKNPEDKTPFETSVSLKCKQ